MGDFLGFEFGGVHSSELGITRVSGGDRYDEDLHPEIKDRTAEVPGVNGEYYFGSDYGTRVFDLEIAFDHLTEDQFRRIRRIFGTKDIKKLVFDERPYKYYMVKLESPIQLSYVCFDEPLKETVTMRGIPYTNEEGVRSYTHEIERVTNQKTRIYKGEGKISLVAHFPFAKSNFKVLPVEGQKYYKGSEGWASSSGILSASERGTIDTYRIWIDEDNKTRHMITVYNPGDIETGFRLYLPAAAVTHGATLLYSNPAVSQTAALKLDPVVLQKGEAGILVDTNSGLILGVPSAPVGQQNNYTYSTNGIIYNRYVSSGYFFKIVPDVSSNVSATIEIVTKGNPAGTLIFYDYLYF